MSLVATIHPRRRPAAALLAVCFHLTPLWALAACGQDDDGGSAAPKTALEGTWVIPCGSDDDSGDPVLYDKSTVTFSGNAYNGAVESFSDASCTSRVLTFRVMGTFVLGAAVAVPAGASEYDSTPTKSFMTIQDELYLKSYNGELSGSTAVCGGGWVLDTERELTTDACPATDDFVYTAEPNYGLAKVDGDRLYWDKQGDAGSTTDGSAPAKRSLTLDSRFAERL